MAQRNSGASLGAILEKLGRDKKKTKYSFESIIYNKIHYHIIIDMSLIKSKLIQNITEANPHLFVRDVERIVNTIFNEITQSLADGKK